MSERAEARRVLETGTGEFGKLIVRPEPAERYVLPRRFIRPLETTAKVMVAACSARVRARDAPAGLTLEATDCVSSSRPVGRSGHLVRHSKGRTFLDPLRESMQTATGRLDRPADQWETV